jgi:hypothetical protein
VLVQSRARRGPNVASARLGPGREGFLAMQAILDDRSPSEQQLKRIMGALARSLPASESNYVPCYLDAEPGTGLLPQSRKVQCPITYSTPPRSSADQSLDGMSVVLRGWSALTLARMS